MNDNAKKWVDALRSGRFEQGTGLLHYFDTDGEQRHCCLGVACVLAVEDGVKLDVTSATGDEALDVNPIACAILYDGYTHVLPRAVQDWFGLTGKTGPLKNKDGTWRERSLADLNDSGKSFEQIADVIEANPEELFFYDD